MFTGGRRETSGSRCPFARRARESVPSRGSAIFASWSTGRWDLTLEGGRWVRQDRGMTFGGRCVHMDLYESGTRYGSMDGKSGLRRAAAGFWVREAQTSLRAAILHLWGGMTAIGGRQASAASIGIGVDWKQFETHLWTCHQKTSIFERMHLLGIRRSAPYRRIGRRSATAERCVRWGERPDPAGERLFTVAKAA